MKEIRKKFKNRTNKPIPAGCLVYTEELKGFKKFLNRLGLYHPSAFVAIAGKMTGIDTSKWKAGQDIYLDPNNPGGLTNIEPCE
ncbi:unnamed protein product [marine sediment metagenome]|uniref:Uncharacterized protein n=1 Tax=marine sediment metagenome TaxID=412755 RepID=X1CM00_9ZZZZ